MIIRLRENPSTGYRWLVTMHGDVHKHSDEFLPHPQDGPDLLIGGGGYRVFTFDGTGTVILTHKRPWEDEEISPAIDVIEINLP